MRAATLLLILMAPSLPTAAEPAFTEDFPLKSCQFSPGRQQVFPAGAGPAALLQQLPLRGGRGMRGARGAVDHHGIRRRGASHSGPVQNRRQVVTRVVEERETEDGELKEISRNYSRCAHPARDLYYFGEEVDIYEDGEIVCHDGAWLAGRHGALPGIIMPDSAFLLGTRYFQEQRPALRWIGPNTLARTSRSTFPRALSKDVSKLARPHRSNRARSPPSSIVPGLEWSSTTSWSSRLSTERQWRGASPGQPPAAQEAVAGDLVCDEFKA